MRTFVHIYLGVLSTLKRTVPVHIVFLLKETIDIFPPSKVLRTLYQLADVYPHELVLCYTAILDF